MSQSIHDQEDSLDEKILRDFHFHPPTINEEVHGELPKISNKAKIFIQSNLSENHFFRFGVAGGGCSGFNYLMDEDTEIKDDDIVFCDTPKAVIDSVSLKYLYGSIINMDDSFGKGLVVENPGAVQRCGCGTSFSFNPDVW